MIAFRPGGDPLRSPPGPESGFRSPSRRGTLGSTRLNKSIFIHRLLWNRHRLAKATEIPAGIIFAMESGAILRDRIKPQHLQMLALVLDESMDRFQLILKPIPRPETISYHGMGYKQSRDKWRPYRPHRDKETPFFSK